MIPERDEKGRFKRRVEEAPGAAGAKTPNAARSTAKAATSKQSLRMKDRLVIFFRELSILCNVSSALSKAGLASQSGRIYDRLGADPDFRARWHQAIAQSYVLLELEMLERERFGDNRPPPKTKVEKRLRQIPSAQAMQLLRLHKSRAKGEAAAPPARATRRIGRARAREIRAKLDRMLSEFNRRMGGEG
ncbi:MAG TPA: hypothetical protein VD887_07985 [Allosphingosinicella sp.]|nr:hypothetical protein [Allosphingosinicella sp.]